MPRSQNKVKNQKKSKLKLNHGQAYVWQYLIALFLEGAIFHDPKFENYAKLTKEEWDNEIEIHESRSPTDLQGYVLIPEQLLERSIDILYSCIYYNPDMVFDLCISSLRVLNSSVSSIDKSIKKRIQRAKGVYNEYYRSSVSQEKIDEMMRCLRIVPELMICTKTNIACHVVLLDIIFTCLFNKIDAAKIIFNTLTDGKKFNNTCTHYYSDDYRENPKNLKGGVVGRKKIPCSNFKFSYVGIDITRLSIYDKKLSYAIFETFPYGEKGMIAVQKRSLSSSRKRLSDKTITQNWNEDITDNYSNFRKLVYGFKKQPGFIDKLTAEFSRLELKYRSETTNLMDVMKKNFEHIQANQFDVQYYIDLTLNNVQNIEQLTSEKKLEKINTLLKKLNNLCIEVKGLIGVSKSYYLQEIKGIMKWYSEQLTEIISEEEHLNSMKELLEKSKNRNEKNNKLVDQILKKLNELQSEYNNYSELWYKMYSAHVDNETYLEEISVIETQCEKTQQDLKHTQNVLLQFKERFKEESKQQDESLQNAKKTKNALTELSDIFHDLKTQKDGIGIQDVLLFMSNNNIIIDDTLEDQLKKAAQKEQNDVEVQLRISEILSKILNLVKQNNSLLNHASNMFNFFDQFYAVSRKEKEQSAQVNNKVDTSVKQQIQHYREECDTYLAKAIKSVESSIESSINENKHRIRVFQNNIKCVEGKITDLSETFKKQTRWLRQKKKLAENKLLDLSTAFDILYNDSEQDINDAKPSTDIVSVESDKFDQAIGGII